MKNQRPGLRYRPQPGPRAPGLRQSPPAGVGRGLCRCALSLPGSLLAGDRPGLSVLSAPSSSPFSTCSFLRSCQWLFHIGVSLLVSLGVHDLCTDSRTPPHPAICLLAQRRLLPLVGLQGWRQAGAECAQIAGSCCLRGNGQVDSFGGKMF